MKNLVALLLAMTTSLSVFGQDKPMTENFVIDPAASTIKWLGKKVTGQHHGNVSVKDGKLTFQGDIITAGEINVDMNTITVTDIPAKDEMNGKLLGHLKSPDFFNVQMYPTSKLVITGSEKTKDGLKVKGNLTFIGETHPIEFVAKVKKDKSTVNAKSDIKIDRTKWGLKYGSGDWFKGLGDKAINNEFTLTVDVTAKK